MFQEKQGMREFCPGREEGEMMDEMKGWWEMMDQMKGWMGRGEKGTQGMLAYQHSGPPAKLG